jgi:hypothetical protein
VTLRDVIARLADFAEDETRDADSATPTARAVVAAEPDGGSVPPAAVTYYAANDAWLPIDEGP